MSTTPTLRDAAGEAAEILRDLIANIERKGMYSQESTLGFIGSAQALLVAALTQGAGAVEPVAWCVEHSAGPANMATRFSEFPAPQWQLESMDAAFPELAPHRNVPLYPAPPAQQLQQAVARAIEECAVLIETTPEWRAPGWTSTICPITTKAIAAAIRAKGTHD